MNKRLLDNDTTYLPQTGKVDRSV